VIVGAAAGAGGYAAKQGAAGKPIDPGDLAIHTAVGGAGGALGAADGIVLGTIGARLVAGAAERGVAEEAIGMAACFVAGTQILMADGTTKPIEQVMAGDHVKASDPGSGTSAAKAVVRVFIHYEVPTWEVVVDGQAVTTTAEHPFWVDGKG